MEFVEIIGKVLGEVTSGTYKVAYLTALEYNTGNKELTICFYGKWITFKMDTTEQVLDKAMEVRHAMQLWHNQRSQK